MCYFLNETESKMDNFYVKYLKSKQLNKHIVFNVDVPLNCLYNN